jgi:glutamate N-acetyltransferase/amino-acid N-acetyltransferase
MSGTMTTGISHVSGGTITTPRGFSAGATYAGIKKPGADALDLGILCSEVPCAAAGVFTTNRIKAAPVVLCQRRLEAGSIQAIVVNAGCANACTGEQGLADAEEMAALAAAKLGLAPHQVLMCSTGVIGASLPMALIRDGIGDVSLSREGGHDLARAIMTTDRVPKETAVRVALGGAGVETSIGGIAKGAGMIHPNMATLLGFLATDASVEPGFLSGTLRRAVDASFNMVTVDGDTSPNDSVIVMANGLAGNEPVRGGTAEADDFERALQDVCVSLARSIAADGEGATRLIEVTVDGAVTAEQARAGARVVSGSPLVKSAVHGSDPNWGRIVAAIGRSGIAVEESKIDLFLGDVCVMRAGRPQRFDGAYARSVLDGPEVAIRIHLNLGGACATAWGCDLSEEYVTINSDYTT